MTNFYKAKGKPKLVGREDFVPTSLMKIAMEGGKAEKQLRRYKVVQCPSCGRIQVTEGKKLDCVYCGHTALFRIRHRWNVKLIQTDDFRKANELCRHWSNCLSKEITSLEEIVDSFGKKTKEVKQNGKENPI